MTSAVIIMLNEIELGNILCQFDSDEKYGPGAYSQLAVKHKLVKAYNEISNEPWEG